MDLKDLVALVDRSALVDQQVQLVDHKDLLVLAEVSVLPVVKQEMLQQLIQLQHQLMLITS